MMKPENQGTSERKKVRKVVRLEDEEFEEKWVEYIETSVKAGIQSEATFFEDPTAPGLAMLPLSRLVKCICGRKFKIWLASNEPQVWIGACPRCKGLQLAGSATELKKADRKQIREWLRRAKQTKKKKHFF